MPIYAYRCATCGHAQDVLQKMSDPVLTVCPACGNATYVKQVTAAGFQLKGSGWYVTDFRGDKKTASPVEAKAGAGVESAPAKAEGDSGKAKPAESGGAKPEAAASPAPAPAAAAPAPAAAPAKPSGD